MPHAYMVQFCAIDSFVLENNSAEKGRDRSKVGIYGATNFANVADTAISVSGLARTGTL